MRTTNNKRMSRQRFIAMIMSEVCPEYGCRKTSTGRSWRKKKTTQHQNNVNQKFIAQIKEFKEYKANPTKKLFDKLFEDNLGIVNFVINRWFAHSVFQSKRDDMLQEGSIGLMSAIRKFNPDLDKKFSPYAILWVRQAIIKYILTDKSVKLPIPLMSAIRKFNDNPELFEAEQLQDPEKAKTAGFKSMMERYRVQQFDVYLDEELKTFDGGEGTQTFKDLLVTNIDNSYSGSVYDGSGTPFMNHGNVSAFTTYEVRGENTQEYVQYIDALTHMTKKDVVVVALRYGFKEEEAVIFADMLQALIESRRGDGDDEEQSDGDGETNLTKNVFFSGLRQFPTVEKQASSGATTSTKGSRVTKRKYITRKEETAADFRTISGIVKDLGFAKVNHATARNIVNSRLFDIASFMNTKRATETEPTEVRKLSEDQIKSIILTSPEFHARFAEVLKGSYAYLLSKKREKENEV